MYDSNGTVTTNSKNATVF